MIKICRKIPVSPVLRRVYAALMLSALYIQKPQGHPLKTTAGKGPSPFHPIILSIQILSHHNSKVVSLNVRLMTQLLGQVRPPVLTSKKGRLTSAYPLPKHPSTGALKKYRNFFAIKFAGIKLNSISLRH
jgi:hypothetical protein